LTKEFIVHLIRWGSERLELRYSLIFSHTLSFSLILSLFLSHCLAIVFTFMRLFLSFLCPCVELAIDKFFISLSDVIGRDRHVRHIFCSVIDMNYDYFPSRFSFTFLSSSGDNPTIFHRTVRDGTQNWRATIRLATLPFLLIIPGMII
jgi:hypothetical protein